MVEASERPCLTREPSRIVPVRIGNGQDLESDVFREGYVTSTVNMPHPSAPSESEDFVAIGETLAGRKGTHGFHISGDMARIFMPRAETLRHIPTRKSEIL